MKKQEEKSLSIEQVEATCIQLLEEINVLKKEYERTISNLETENQHLRERLYDLDHLQEETKEEEHSELLSRSRRNLEKLYEEGYHVCQASYGGKREDSCMFCLGILYPNDEER